MIWAFVFWLNVWPFMELFEFTGGHEKNSCQAYETHLIGKKTIRFFTNLQNTQPQAIHYNTLWQLRKKNSEKIQHRLLWLIQFTKKWNDKNSRIFSNWSRSAISCYLFQSPITFKQSSAKFQFKSLCEFFFVECCGKKFLLRT